jgi:glutaredoxin
MQSKNENGNLSTPTTKLEKNNSDFTHTLNKYISSGKVVIFAYSYCPNCTKATELLSNLNINAEIFLLDKDPNLKQNKKLKSALEINSNSNVYPKIYLGLSCIGTYSDLYDLFTQNKLFEILKSEGINFIEDDYY